MEALAKRDMMPDEQVMYDQADAAEVKVRRSADGLYLLITAAGEYIFSDGFGNALASPGDVVSVLDRLADR